MAESSRPPIAIIMCDQPRADFVSPAGFPLPRRAALVAWAVEQGVRRAAPVPRAAGPRARAAAR